MAIDFGDLASRYASARWDQATQPFTDPEAYMNNRLQQNFGVDMNGNTTPVSTTIKYNTDTGAPETVTTKHEVGATPAPDYTAGANYNLAAPATAGFGLQTPATAQPIGMQMPQAVAPTAMPVPNVENQAIEEQKRKQLEQLQLQAAQAQAAQAAAPAPTGPAVPTVEREMPQPAPTAPVTPQAVAQQAAPAPTIAPPPAIGTLPTPGPGVQVAAAPGAALPVTQPAAVTTPTVTLAPAPTPATWQTDLTSIQHDPTKLAAYVGNEANPENARKIAGTLWRKQEEMRAKGLDIEKLMVDVANGDVKAINTFAKDIKKPSEEGSLLKAYMFNRLGLTELAKEEQLKIRGGGVTSEMMDGEYYTIEKNSRGEVVRAWNSDGNSLNRDKVAQLQAAGQKTGTHAFSSTGGVYTIPEGQPDAGQEYARRFSAQTGKFENVITSGPNANKIYTGSPGYEKRVETNAAVKLNSAYVDFQTKPTIAMATTMLELAGKVDDGKNNAINNAMTEIQRRSPAIFNQVAPLAGSITGQPPAAAPATVTRPASGAAPVIRPTTGAVTPQQVQAQAVTPTAGGGGGSLLAQSTQIPESIKTSEETKRAELKPPAEAKGKNAAKDINDQRQADETYKIIQPISAAIKQSTGSGIGAGVDQLASVIGVGTQGAQNIAKLDVLGYKLLQQVPRMEGSQSNIDVEMYRQAAGDLANSKKPVAIRLEALKTIIEMLKIADKAGKNDWTYGGNAQSEVRNRADAIIGGGR